VSQALAVVSPFVLKVIVDGMTNCLMKADFNILRASMAAATTFP
jgi:hypothetical protein